MIEETELIEKVKSGDGHAFGKLYDAHVWQLYRFLKQFSQDSDQVEEWVQRAFIKAFKNIDAFEGRSKFSSWLIKLGINEMRMDRRQVLVFSLNEMGQADEATTDTANEFEWNETMRSLIAKLSDEKKTVFLLHAVEGYSHSEIASTLGITESSSRSILTRTKKILQHEWNKEKLS